MSSFVALGVWAACVPGDPGPRGKVAIKLVGDNLFLRVVACETPVDVRSVELAAASDRQDIRWLVESSSGSSRTEFVVGDAPPGFTERRGFDKTFEPGEHYLVVILLGDLANPFSTEFDPSELSEDYWLLRRGERVTETELDNLKPCD